MHTGKNCTLAQAMALVHSGDRVMIGGFGDAGLPDVLVEALADSGLRDLTIISCGLGSGPEHGLGRLLYNGQVRELIGTHYNRNPEVARQYYQGKLQVTLLPLGTLIESIRAGGAGIPAYFTPTAVGTELATGKETRIFDGKPYVMERALQADVALICAAQADTLGNLVYRKTARNFNPMMATAAGTVITQVGEIVPAGHLDPERIETPHLYVDRLVEVQ